MSVEGLNWKERTKQILSQRNRVEIIRRGYRPAAVLIPVYEHPSDYYVVLTQRSNELLHHKGQISFPGGRYDEVDGELKVTALRETCEEIGVKPEDIEVLGMLDDQATLTTNYRITPFVGIIPYPYEFNISAYEVAELIEVPISMLLDPGNFSPVTPDNEGVVHPWGSFRFATHHITGITAKILMQFLALAFDWRASARSIGK